MRGKGGVACIDLMWGIFCNGKKDIPLQLVRINM